MSIDIDHLSIEELEQLHHRIVERLKFLDGVQTHRDMMAFNLGNQVCFDTPKHGRVFGTIIKFNRKTVSVLTTDGRKWNVSPHLLTEVKDVTPASRSVDAPGARRG